MDVLTGMTGARMMLLGQGEDRCAAQASLTSSSRHTTPEVRERLADGVDVVLRSEDVELLELLFGGSLSIATQGIEPRFVRATIRRA